MIVGIDLHGLILDHRVAKHAFFCEVAGCEYSSPYIDRAQILRELAAKGLGEDFYFNTFNRFLHSEYYERAELSPGFRDFLLAAPPDWNISIISTAPFNTVESVAHTLSRFGLPRISNLMIATDAERGMALWRAGVVLYFDDKSQLLAGVAGLDILVVQVSAVGYSELSPYARFHFRSWHEVILYLSDITTECIRFR